MILLIFREEEADGPTNGRCHDPHFRPMNESMTEVAIPFLPNERTHLHIQQNPVAEFIDPLELKAAKSGVKGGVTHIPL